jgi:hypothetical protein
MLGMTTLRNLMATSFGNGGSSVTSVVPAPVRARSLDQQAGDEMQDALEINHAVTGVLENSPIMVNRDNLVARAMQSFEARYRRRVSIDKVEEWIDTATADGRIFERNPLGGRFYVLNPAYLGVIYAAPGITD